MANVKYDRDFYAWANEQAALLRAGEVSRADVENIAEELERLGRTEKREFVGRLTALLSLLLKARFQRRKRSPSWKTEIESARGQLLEHLQDNPSLKDKLPEAIAAAFRNARRSAVDEAGPEDGAFPAACPWTFERMIDEKFWPD
jgi:predicted  nucleic acid-binding Zn-ribbon protein